MKDFKNGVKTQNLSKDTFRFNSRAIFFTLHGLILFNPHTFFHSSKSSSDSKKYNFKHAFNFLLGAFFTQKTFRTFSSFFSTQPELIPKRWVFHVAPCIMKSNLNSIAYFWIMFNYTTKRTLQNLLMRFRKNI